jgi:hypothetical protein
MNIMTRIRLWIECRARIRGIEKEMLVEYDRRFEQAKEELIHDTRVPDEDLGCRALEIAQNLRLELHATARRRVANEVANLKVRLSR